MIQNVQSFNHSLFKKPLVVPRLLEIDRFPGLDGLRGISIIMVILSHFFMHTTYTKSFVGSLGVQFFFVISGFLITSLLLKEKVRTGKISLKKFYLRRLIRILPVAYLFIITLASLNYFLKLGINFKQFLQASLFLQNLPFNTGNWYLRHYWSLSVEEQFYISFPFLLVYNLNVYTKAAIAFVILLPILQLLGYNNVGAFYTNRTLHIITYAIIHLFGNTTYILIGSLSSIFLFKGIINMRNTGVMRYLSFFLFVLILLIRTDSSWFTIPNSELIICPILSAMVIVLNLNPESIFTKILNYKYLAYTGVISYSLYIWQQLFDNANYHIVPVNSYWVQLICLLGISIISYHFYERWFLKLKVKFKALN